ncbi:uncharacterized protein LOC133290604 isoform X1 [Gastrolobium bilobum]|uniref:uncharacterized protein LOC133290604 isoform X1 n=1 Tax=Gastrolobium bilobum TaxID=150636 RepID=UPI002AB10D17|nr:uncharacterized protein LOC133290604 isoform X1 [Gastrolobium bilobum]
MLMLSSSSSSSSSSPFFHVPTHVIQPRKQQQLQLWKVPPFHQTTLQSSLLTCVYLPCSLRRNLHKCFLERQSQSAQEEEEQQQAFEFERLFSNLNQATLKREPGSLSSAIFLVAGTTVGAGILAIPAVTQEAGFLASAVTCILCWIFMVVTGLLIAEVNVRTMCELGSGGVSLVSMARRTLGTAGVQISCWSYIFIHYALLVAYVARSSDILTNFLGIPIWLSATLFSLISGGICFFGSQRFIGAVNGVLIFGIISSFAALVAVASGDIHLDALLKANFQAAPMSIPIIALSFVYQNVVPVLCTNLEGDLSKVFSCRTAIILGTGIPLSLFLIWDAVILGTISDNVMGLDPLQQLRSTNGTVGPIVEVFSLLAIATSYIGFVLGLSDFLADLLKLPTGQNRPLPYILTLCPPLILSLLDPEIFFKALDFAGTYGVLVLFGVVPAAMSWSDRYSNSSPSAKLPDLVPGGRITLLLVLGGSGCVVLSELIENLQHL